MSIQYQPEEERLILPEMEKEKGAEYKCSSKKGNPYYNMNADTQKIVLGLIEKCKELKLGNVSFHYYYTPENKDEIEFFLCEYKEYWELVVRCRRKKVADIYWISANEIAYQYSEQD
ncbi:MAG: hypothetical protein ACOCG5_04320 [Candidatus Alkaliphilus sp. MAG34]